jgi:hypothetical protein
MAEKQDWMYRPVIEGMVSADKLYDCSLDLFHFAEMNEAIDVKLENERRFREANKDG